MALSSSTAAHVVDTMAPEMAPRIVNPYPNKVIHADIRIQGVEEDRRQDGFPPQSDEPEPVVESKPSAADVEYQDRAAEMQNWWAEAMARNMDLPEGYSKVAVLLIKWAPELDELNTGDEARELDTLFRDRFHYETKIVELNVGKKPQHQLNNYVSEFICEHDGPDNLLIVYYTGHGVYDDRRKCLELTGSLKNNPLLHLGFRRNARATWNQAEDQLRREDVEGDVLTILDTCYSSNFVKSGRDGQKIFELLSACSIDQTTEAPGDNSYTRALIDAITVALDKEPEQPISTFRLFQDINRDSRRKDTPSQLWSRGKRTHYNEPHIFLAPLKSKKSNALHQPRHRPKPKGYLTLRFGLRDSSLSQEQIEFMTRLLSKAFGNKALVGLRRIDWMDIEPAPPTSHFERVASIMRVIAQWKRVITKKKRERESQQTSQRRVDEITFPHSTEVASDRRSPKRAHEGLDELPDAKRQYLDTAQPPSPPVSDS
ncbi:hypothetical protein BDW02DRAFT_486233 [Decorospora gaudefroyi]|uniref:Caspase domain-containing protein n=1 Tax=Decorospora gaudefroyi TaxID=184978 RepID=A0A6A5KMM5_9PLEO|nr:hypothetical protein BDW02DRAFT_486233 [Decorospora gaudefroyi]